MDIRPESPANVFTDLGIQYLMRGKNDLALENFKTALDADSQSSEAHHAIAILFQRLKRDDLREDHLKQAVSLRPSNASAQTDYGNFLCERENYVEADAHYQKAIATPLYQSPWRAMTSAGICAQRAGRLDAAEKYLREALKVRPNFGPALLALAKISLESGSAFSGRAFIQRYLIGKRSSAEALRVGVEIEEALGDQAAAEAYRSRLRSEFPDSDEATSLDE